MKSFTLVVSRYTESINWLFDLPKDMNIVVFNKGKKIDSNYENIKIINDIPNIGREGDSYLRYISLEYENLPEFVCFTQADPFGHHPRYLKRLLEVFNNGFQESIMPLTTRWNYNFPPMNLVKKYEDSFYLETINRFTLCPVMYWDIGIRDIYNQYCAIYNIPPGQDVYNHFCNLIGLEDLDHGKTLYANFFYSGCFCVKREAIKEQSKDFYLNCLKLIGISNLYGLMFERIWWKLFGGKSDPEMLSKKNLS